MPFRSSIPLGAYIGRYQDSWSDNNASAGNNSYAFGAVPEGEIWYIEAVMGYDLNNLLDFIRYNVTTASGYVSVVSFDPTADDTGPTLPYPLWLIPGEYVTVVLGGATAGDDLRAFVMGHKFALEIE